MLYNFLFLLVANQNLILLLASRALLELLLLFDDGELDALAAGERHPRLGALADHEDVAGAGGEVVAALVLKGEKAERARVSLDGGDDSDATSVGAASDASAVALLKLDEVDDLASGNIKLDSVVVLHVRVGVADGAAIVCHNVRDGCGLSVVEGVAADAGLGASGNLLYLAEFVFGLLRADAVENKAALVIEEETVVLSSLVNRDNIHEAGGVVDVGADLVVDLDQAAHDNHHDFLAREGVLETVPEHQWKGGGPRHRRACQASSA